jgi:hypothetical protein
VKIIMTVLNGVEHLYLGTPTSGYQNAKIPKPDWPYLLWCYVVHSCYIVVFFMSYTTLGLEIDNTFCKFAFGYGLMLVGSLYFKNFWVHVYIIIFNVRSLNFRSMKYFKK